MTMILMKKVLKLTEEEMEKRPADEVWAEGEPEIYRTSTLYSVRQIKNSMPVKFEVFKQNGSTRKEYGTFNSIELKQAFTPIRPNQTPDAEGFITYIDPEKIEAFQFKGEPCMVLLDGDSNPAKISKGDYLVRTTEGSSFVYTVESEADFESTMIKV